jgi:transposase-like protein
LNGGAEYLKTLQTRDLSEKELIAVFLDGVVLSKDVVVLVALGATADGEKKVIDFEMGELWMASALLDAEKGFN